MCPFSLPPGDDRAKHGAAAPAEELPGALVCLPRFLASRVLHGGRGKASAEDRALCLVSIESSLEGGKGSGEGHGGQIGKRWATRLCVGVGGGGVVGGCVEPVELGHREPLEPAR